MNDIAIPFEEGRFNYRACAVILHEGKLLAMHDERSPYYYLPGGRVQFSERVEDAVLREVREELQIEASIVRPLWLNQAFFTEDVSGERFHELCLYFLMDITKTELLSRGAVFTIMEGRHTHVFEWLPIESLEERYLYPKFIKKAVFHLPDTLTIRAEYE